MKKKEIIVLMFLIILTLPIISAGIFDFLKKEITGKATSQSFSMNVSVLSGPPVIYNVSAPSSITLTEGPSPTFVIINFSVNDSDGASNLINSSASINLTKSGEQTRFNNSCAIKDYGGYSANFTCNVTLWWFDGDGTWNILVNISDANYHVSSNTTKTIQINTLSGFVMHPSYLNFSTLTPGTYNQTPSNFLTLNNTGNQNIASGNIQINASDLRGETNPGHALWAGNFSASQYQGLEIQCNVANGSATSLVNRTYTGIPGLTLPKGNYTLNDGSTGQERVYFCLREVGAELSQQYYSTQNLGAWTIRIV